MRQVFLEGNLVTVKEVCKPNLDDNALLVSVHYSFISPETEEFTHHNNSLTALNGWTKNIAKTLDSLAYTNIINLKSPIDKSIIQALGYSCCGQVVSIGKSIKNFRPGDYVACMGIGIAHHADFVCVPENYAVKIHNTDKMPQASAIALGTRAVEIFLQSNANLGDTVCIIGLDFLGLLIMQIAEAAGCQVIGIDTTNHKLLHAQKAGAYKLFKLSDPSLVDDIIHYTQGKGVSRLIITDQICATDEKKINSLVCDKGTIIITDSTHFKFSQTPNQKELNLFLTKNHTPTMQEKTSSMHIFINLLEQNKIKIESLIDQYYPLERIQQAYDTLKNSSTSGIILTYLPKNVEIEEPHQNVPPCKKTDATRLGIIGIDHYAEKQLLPLLHRLNKSEVHAIINSDLAKALEIAKKYKHATIVSDEQTVLDKDLCDTFILNLTDSYESDKIIRLLSAGKALFMQNFMANNPEQLKKLKTFLHNNPSSKFCINYKRSFSPFMQKIKKAIQKRNTPLMIHYRFNDTISKKNNNEMGHEAGKIINQAGHIIDLFCFLTEATPIAVSVESLNQSHDKVFPTDNFCAHISFDDGSVCSLMFTCIGHHTSSKERMELFFDSKTIVMNDFISLAGYGLPKSFNEKVFNPDYGQEEIIKQFLTNITTNDSPLIPFERLSAVAQITLAIDQLACQGGGIQ